MTESSAILHVNYWTTAVRVLAPSSIVTVTSLLLTQGTSILPSDPIVQFVFANEAKPHLPQLLFQQTAISNFPELLPLAIFAEVTAPLKTFVKVWPAVIWPLIFASVIDQLLWSPGSQTDWVPLFLIIKVSLPVVVPDGEATKFFPVKVFELHVTEMLEGAKTEPDLEAVNW